jgi:NAD(P)-dependent dehydrogenase (short-subunit alcohol dehydrogenase family)
MDEKVAIVTGAGSGIGRAVGLALHATGYSVVLAGRRAEQLEQTAALGVRDALGMIPMPCDVTLETDVNELFDCVEQRFGRLDVLFNNAGMSAPDVPFEDLSLDQWNEIVAVNLTGAFLCAQRAVRAMKKQNPRGGRIINNGSVSAHSPRPNSLPYTTTKHAITGLTKSISLDCRKYDIACGQIDIGNASTDMTQSIRHGVLQPDGTVSSEPQMDSRHVADAILYMVNLPLEANVQFMTVMATKMPFIGRG